MTKDAFIDHWRFQLGGIVLDATGCRTAEERALFLRSVFAKIDRHLGQMYDQLLPPKPVEAKVEPQRNGQPLTRTPASK